MDTVHQAQITPNKNSRQTELDPLRLLVTMVLQQHVCLSLEVMGKLI